MESWILSLFNLGNTPSEILQSRDSIVQKYHDKDVDFEHNHVYSGFGGYLKT